MSAQQQTSSLIAGKLPRDDYATLQEIHEAFAAALTLPSPPSAQVISKLGAAGSGLKPVTAKRLLTDGATSVNVGVSLTGAILNLVRTSAAPAVYIKGLSGEDGSTVHFSGAISGDDNFLAYTLLK